MLLKSPLPNQTRDIYTLLLKKGPLNAEQIGKELNIFPHAVYRSTDQLKSLGCVSQISTRPALFEAQPVHDSVETFSLLQREWFLKAFLAKHKKQDGFIEQDLQTSFIDSREGMFDRMVPDFETIKEELDLLISGDEAPAEIILAQKHFIERGGIIRTLAQKRNEQNEPFLKAHKQMGEQVRVIDLVKTRLMIFDRRIVYVMSYDPENIFKSVGIRFDYAPLGQLMHSLFMQYWEIGKEI